MSRMPGSERFVVVVIDDDRYLETGDGREVTHLRSSADAVAWLTTAAASGVEITQLWLDYDLRGSDTIEPVLDHLVAHPVVAGDVIAHTANEAGARIIRERLAGHYQLRRVRAGTGGAPSRRSRRRR